MGKRKVVAVLLDTRDGTQNEYLEEWAYDEDGLLFYWTHGNFSCDCNRSIVMYGLDSDETINCNTGIEDNIIKLLSLKLDGVELLENGKLASDDLIDTSEGGFLVPMDLLHTHWADLPVERKDKASQLSRWLGCKIGWFSRVFVVAGNWVFNLGMTTKRIKQRGLLDFYDETDWKITRSGEDEI